MLPCRGILLRNLILQMFLPLLQHIQLLPQEQDSVLGGILALLSGSAAEPGPHIGSYRKEKNSVSRGLWLFKVSDQAAPATKGRVYRARQIRAASQTEVEVGGLRQSTPRKITKDTGTATQEDRERKKTW